MEIHQLIAAINSDVFCKQSARRDVKRILQAAKMRAVSPDYSAAAAKATPVEPNQTAVEHLEQQNPFRLPAFESPPSRARAPRPGNLKMGLIRGAALITTTRTAAARKPTSTSTKDILR